VSIDVRVVPSAAFGSAALDALVELCKPFASPAVGLATGSTPIPLYEALRDAPAHAKVEAMRPFAIDEWGGPADHPCSNATFFRRYWDVIPGARPVVQFDAAAPDPEQEAIRFGKALAATGGLDVVVLGIGRNGHLAFNEPGTSRTASVRWTALAATTRASARACFGDDAPAHGLTLGLAELLGARSALLLASGAHKASIVARALEGEIGPECPASFLREHPRAIVLLDQEAAAQLRPGGSLRRS